jgi:hypothetical protein
MRNFIHSFCQPKWTLIGERSAADVIALAVWGDTLVHDRIDGKRDLLHEEMQRYFWETCSALATRCEVAIGLPPVARREVVGRLQTLRSITHETNRELTSARIAVAQGQIPDKILLDRALASIEHLNEVAQTMTRWMDELLNS